MPKWIVINNYTLEFIVPFKYLEEKGLNEDRYDCMGSMDKEYWLRKYYNEKKEGITIYVIDYDCITPYGHLYIKNIKKHYHPNSFKSFSEYSFDRFKKWVDLRDFMKENLNLFGFHMMEYREIDKWSIVDLTKEDVCSNCSKVVKKGELTRYTIFNEQKEVCEYCLFKLDKEVHENLSEVGYVYFLKEFNSNNVKIGKTKNLKHRVTTLKSMLPYKSELIHYIITPKYSVTETFFHNLFQGKKVKGEWFNLEPDDINFIINFKEIEVCV